MKRILFAVALMVGGASIYAQTDAKNDTLVVVNEKIKSVIQDETINSNGKKVVKYYILYAGELVQTSKNVAEKYRLCQKHGAKCALAIVKNKKTNRKRIILN